MATRITSQGVVTERLDTIIQSLAGREIQQVTSDYTTTSNRKIPDSLALYTAFDVLKDRIDQEGGSTPSFGLIGPSLVSANWNLSAEDPDLGWLISSHYQRLDNTLIITSAPVDNLIRVPQGRLTKSGYYVLSLTVTELSGSVRVMFNGSQQDPLITVAGKHLFLLKSTLPSIDMISITCRDIALNNRTVLTNPYLVAIDDKLADYLDVLFTVRLEGLIDGLATETYVDDKVQEVHDYATGLMEDHESSADPHPQYIKRTEVPEFLVPDLILKGRPALPIADDILPAKKVILRTKTLAHSADSSYDPMQGRLSSDKYSPNLQDAVKNTLPKLSRMALFPNSNASLKLKYSLRETRMINKVVLITDHPDQTSYPDHVKVTVGSYTQTVSLQGIRLTQSQNSFYFNVSIPNVQASVVDVEVLDVLGDQNGTISFGLSIEFSDTVGLTIASGVVFSAATTTDGVNTFSVQPASELSLDNLVPDHPYVVSYIAGTNTVERLPYLPPYSKSEAFSATMSYAPYSPYYGTIYTTGFVNGESDVRSLISSRAIEITPSGPVYVKHVFPNLKLGEYELHLKGSPDQNTFTLVTTLSDDSTVQYDSSSAHTTYLNGYTRYIVSIPNVTLKAVDINISTSNPVKRLIPKFRSIWFSTEINTWSDNLPRKLMGGVTKSSLGEISITEALTQQENQFIINGYSNLKLLTNYTFLNPSLKPVKSLDTNTNNVNISATQAEILLTSLTTEPCIVTID